MEDRDKILDYTKPVRLPDDCGKNRKNFTQGYYYREIGRYRNVVPSEFQWAAEDKLINKTTYEELKCQLPDSPRSTFLMVFSPDGKKVASTHGNHNVYVTDLTTGKNIQTLSGHPRTPWCIAFHPSSNQILASGCLGGQVRVWDLHGGSEVWTAESQTVIASLAFHPVDRMLVIATYNELHFWDWSQPEPFAKCSTKSRREKVRYVSFDLLGNKLITGIANPVNVPSQWDRINAVNDQPPMTSSTTTTSVSASFNSTPPTTMVSSQTNDHGRSTASWYRNSINRRLVHISRNTPTIDRGTDPMDLQYLRNNRNINSEGSTSNSSLSTSSSQVNPSSSLRFEITRSAGRSYRPLSSRERFRIHSSVFRRLSSRSSHPSNSTTSNATVSQSSVSTIPSTSSPTTPISRDSSISRLGRWAISLGPTPRSWCVALSSEDSTSLFSTRSTSQSLTPTAITTPTFTSYSDRVIFSTRESSSNLERTQFSVVRPYRLLFDDINDNRTPSQRESQSEPERELADEPRTNLLLSPERNENQIIFGNNLTSHSSEAARSSSNRDSGIHSPEIEIERELERSTLGLRRQDTESVESNGESPYGSEFFQNSRSSTFQSIPVNLRNLSPVRRFREDTNSDGELIESSSRESHSLPQSLMHPRPVPRFQIRSRLFQDQQSQLHLLTNRETHGLNLQNNQTFRRQLSFRPGGQFVLSRHSNSPFQPRVPYQSDGSTQMNSSAAVKNNDSRFEVPSLGSLVNTSDSNASELSTSSSPSTGNNFFSNSIASNLSFTGESSSRQLPDQINRRLFDRVKMMLRDRIRNSSENASTDSTVNYSRISGEAESERDPLDCEEGVASRGLGPRSTDPMLSSVSENFDSTNELLQNSGSSSPVFTSANGVSSNSNNFSISQYEFLDPWETETNPTSFSISAPSPLNDALNEQSQSVQEFTTRSEAESIAQNSASSASNNNVMDNSNPSSSEFSMRQGIQLLSLHIENMQRLCWARIEILQLQKIRRMWEDLTNQIRQFHNIIQNRTLEENLISSRSIDSSSSSGYIPSMRNLAISSSPVPERSVECSTYSETLNDSSIGSFSNNYRGMVDTEINELLNKRLDLSCSKNSSSNIIQKSENCSAGSSVEKNSAEENHSSNTKPSKRETEEPQPGPSGLSTPSTSGGFRNSILQLEYRVYKLLRDLIQKTRRRREGRDLGMNTSSGYQRSNQSSAARTSLRTKLRSHKFTHLNSSTILSRELESIWQTWRKERMANKTSQSARPNGSCETVKPCTSTAKPSTSSDACQSCGQKKKPVKEFNRQKRKSMESSSDSGPSCSASKVLKNNVGERSKAPNKEIQEEETSIASSSQTQESCTNDLLKQMLQTMETMLHFQREAFQSNRESPKGHLTRQTGCETSSGEDSDSDQNNSNEQKGTFTKSATRKGSRESIVNLIQVSARLRAKRLLGYMIKRLNHFLGKNFRDLDQVLDGQIFNLYILLDLALKLTDLFLEQLNSRSHDLERNRAIDNPENEGRNSALSNTTGGGERFRERNRRTYLPLYSTNREDFRNRFAANPFLRSHASLISNRYNSSGTPNTVHERFSCGAFSNNCRRKRITARMSISGLPRWYYRRGRTSSQVSSNSSNSTTSNRSLGGNSFCNRYRSFCSNRRLSGENNLGLRVFNYEINNNDANNNYGSNDGRNNNISNTNANNNNNNNNTNNNFNNNDNNNYNHNSVNTSTNNNNNNYNNNNNNNNNSISSSSSSSSNNNNNNNNNSTSINFENDNNITINIDNDNNNSSSNNNRSSSSTSNSNNIDSRSTVGGSNNSNINNNNHNSLNYYFPNSGNSSSNSENGNNIVIVAGLTTLNNFINSPQGPLLRPIQLTYSLSENGDLSLRDARPIFQGRYGGNTETSGALNSSDSQSRVNSFTVPVVQVNDVPVSDVSMLNQPRHRPQSPVPRVSEDISRWRAWRPRFLHPRYGGPNPFDDQDSNDLPENIHYYRISSTSAGSHLGIYTLDPMIITDAPMSAHHRIQAWDFSKMKIPDISDREANGVVPECKIHNDASVDVSNDGHLLVALLPSGRLSVTTMLGVYSLDWSSLGQLLYRTSFEQNAVSVSLSPTSRHLLVGLASRPVILRDRTNMAQIFRLEGGRPSPHGGSWQSGRGRLVHMRDLEQTREMNIMSLNCIRWAPGAGQGLVYGTNTGQLKVLR